MTGRLRITGGVLSRRLFDVPPAAERGTLRPTSDRVREGLFSSLQSRFEFDAMHVADLCCGSGALGFEALSRGAGHVTFVDIDRRTMAVVANNARDLQVVDRCTFITGPVMAFLDRPAPQHGFDMVFFDPPYAMVVDAATRAGLARQCAPGGVLVVERASKSADQPFEGLSIVDERRYGDTRLGIWQRQE